MAELKNFNTLAGNFYVNDYPLIKIMTMIIVHDIFICKPGNASKFAKLFKEVMADNTELVNIMTDMTGDYNKVVMVTKYDNLTAYDRVFKNTCKTVRNEKDERKNAGIS